MIPMTCPSGSAKSAIVVSGATSVSGIRTRPPAASARASVALRVVGVDVERHAALRPFLRAPIPPVSPSSWRYMP